MSAQSLPRQIGATSAPNDVIVPVHKRPPPQLSRLICAAFLIGDPFSYRCALAAPESHATPEVRFDIPAGPATETLKALASQGHASILYDPGEISGVTTPAIVGVFSLEQALEKILHDTSLTYSLTSGHLVAVARATPTTLPPPPLPAPARRTPPLDISPSIPTESVLVEADHTSFGSLSAGARPIALFDRDAIDRRNPVDLPDLLRTQSQVFGGGPTEYTSTGREAGTNSVLGSGVNLRGLDAGATMILIDGRRVAPSGSSGAFSDISNIPLSAVQKVEIMPDGAATRYGADAPGGVVNISMRNNFVGSQLDARFGSVTNGAVQEKRYDGLWGAPLSFGDGGHVMFGFEYFHRDALAAEDRSQVTGDLGTLGANFTQTYGNPGTLVIGAQTWKIPSNPTKSPDAFVAGSQSYSPHLGSTVLPDQKRMSAVGSLHLNLDERWEGFCDALGTIRNVSAAAPASTAALVIPTTSPYYFDPTGTNAESETVQYSFLDSLGPQALRGTVKTLNAETGLNFDSGNWRWTGSVNFAGEKELQRISGLLNYTNLQSTLNDEFDPFGFGGHTNSAILPEIGAYRDFKSSSYYYGGRLSVDGLLHQVRAGFVKVSSGLEFRRQTLNEDTSGSFVPLELAQALGRTTQSVFSELWIPLFSPQHRITGFERLELSAAARFDRYSDVGHALAPSFGIHWSPVQGLSLQGNFSRSFRPPNLIDHSEVQNQSIIAPLEDTPASARATQTLIWLGGNSQLGPESARSWTAGLSWIPPLSLGSSLALTFFDITVHNRLNQPELSSALLDDAAYAGRITRKPTSPQQDAVCQHSAFQGGDTATCMSTPIDSILDLRVRNVAELQTRGIDFSANLAHPTSAGTLGWRLEGTYLLKYALTPNDHSPATSLLNRQNNPINLRFNTEGYWKYRNLQLATLVTYANSYRNWEVAPARGIASWTIVDMSASYVIETARRSLLSDITLSARVQNLFNRMPPFINNTVETVGYDQENSSVLGRFVSFSVRTQF